MNVGPSPARRQGGARCGFTLFELLCYVAASTLVFALLDVAVTETLRLSSARERPANAGAALDRVCDRLRVDGAGGWRVDGAALIAGGARWTVARGNLLRDGVRVLPATALAWRVEADGCLAVELRPQGAPVRGVLLPPASAAAGAQR